MIVTCLMSHLGKIMREYFYNVSFYSEGLFCLFPMELKGCLERTVIGRGRDIKAFYYTPYDR